MASSGYGLRGGREARRLASVLVGLLLVGGAGCQTIHVLVPLPATVKHEERIPRRVGYYVSGKTLGLQRHVQTSMPWFGFGVDTFVIQPGRVADEFARAYLREAFDGFERLADPDLGTSGVDFLITLDVLRFTLENRRAEFEVVARVTDRGGGLVQEVTAVGESASYGGRIAWALGGSFAFTLLGYYFLPIPTPPTDTITAQIGRAIYESVNGEMHNAFASILGDLRRGSPDWGPEEGG